MHNSLPHPSRNDPRNRHTPLRSSQDQDAQAALTTQNNLPSTQLTHADLDNARTLLERCSYGVSYRNVLKDIATSAWVIEGFGADTTLLTKALIRFDPQLTEAYRASRSSETLLARALELFSLLPQPLASIKFLKDLSGLNNIIHEMNEAGLVQVEYRGAKWGYHVETATSVPMIDPKLTIRASDLGKLALMP